MIKSECSQKGKNKDCQMGKQDQGLPDGDMDDKNLKYCFKVI